jgi:hypothetical protein
MYSKASRDGISASSQTTIDPKKRMFPEDVLVKMYYFAIEL